MTQVDFYVLEPAAAGDRFQLACRIAEKARRAGHRVLIHSPLETETRHIDGLLWTLWERSFIPHGETELTIRDATGEIVYQRVLLYDIEAVTDSGVAGTWQVTIDLFGVTGRVGLTLTKEE